MKIAQRILHELLRLLSRKFTLFFSCFAVVLAVRFLSGSQSWAVNKSKENRTKLLAKKYSRHNLQSQENERKKKSHNKNSFT